MKLMGNAYSQNNIRKAILKKKNSMEMHANFTQKKKIMINVNMVF